jgi:hypothetical protein
MRLTWQARARRLNGGAASHQRNRLWRQNQQTGKKTGKSGGLTLTSTHSGPNDSHISAKRQDNAPPAQFGTGNYQGIRVLV